MTAYKPEIKFTHITKTGGTSIEAVGREHGYLWGKADRTYLARFRRTRPARIRKGDTLWHLPLREFEKNPYEGCLVFTVVRDPYTRVVSEFHCPWFGAGNTHLHTPASFNEWVRDNLRTAIDRSHLCPQVFHVFDRDGRQLVDAILRFETLETEFNDFIEPYRPSCRLTKFENRTPATRRTIDADSLDRQSIDLINAFYRDDFETFRYHRR